MKWFPSTNQQACWAYDELGCSHCRHDEHDECPILLISIVATCVADMPNEWNADDEDGTNLHCVRYERMKDV